MSVLAARSLAIAVALLAGCVLFAETRDYGLLGFDTHPLIASARVESPADLAGLASERLMDGRYPSAFHRPLVSASFAVDEALWGLDAFGYQLTGAIAFTLLLLGLAALGETVAGGASGGRWLTVALPLLVALHPSFYEVVPIPARRADLLCALFATAAVVAMLRGRPWAAAAGALAAILSKESGYAAPPLLVVSAWLRPVVPRRGAMEALRDAAPAFGGAALALAVRLSVLGGLGGHRDGVGIGATLAELPGVTLELATGSLLAGTSLTGRPAPVAAAALLVGAALVVVGLVRTRGEPGGEGALTGARRGVLLGLAWSGAFGATYAAAGWVGAWYHLLPAIGALLAAASAVSGAVTLARSDAAGPPLRAVGALAAVLLAGVLAWQASFAPAFRSYGEWERATAVADEFLGELGARIAAARPGERIEAPPIPMWAAPREGIPGVRGAAILSDYSVQAWAELAYPERRIRVLGLPDGVLPPGPVEPAADEIVVRLGRRRVGY